MGKSKAVVTPPSSEMLNEQIARKAYELYEKRGGSHGSDLDDWLTAEHFIQDAIVTQASPLKAKSKVVSMKRKK